MRSQSVVRIQLRNDRTPVIRDALAFLGVATAAFRLGFFVRKSGSYLSEQEWNRRFTFGVVVWAIGGLVSIAVLMTLLTTSYRDAAAAELLWLAWLLGFGLVMLGYGVADRWGFRLMEGWRHAKPGPVPIICATMILIAAGVIWVGRYQFTQVQLGDVSIPVRVNRITGETHMFDPSESRWVEKWPVASLKPVAEQDERNPTPPSAAEVEERRNAVIRVRERTMRENSIRASSKPVPANVLKSIDADVNFNRSTPGFGGFIYNWSDWTITHIKFRVTATSKDGKTTVGTNVLARNFFLEPRGTDAFSFAIPTVSPDTGLYWSFEEALGVPPFQIGPAIR